MMLRFSILKKNIENNKQSLFIILFFAVVFWTFNIYRSSHAGGKDKKPKEVIRIALYKQGMDKTEVTDYFKYFSDTLESVLEENDWEVIIESYGGDIKQVVCKGIREGNTHIAGELSPIEYVNHYQNYKFKPFLGMEYNDKAFYHSVFFGPDDEGRWGWTLSSAPGMDNIGAIKKKLDDYESARVAVDNGRSTSGYWYPLSYLLSQGIRLERIQELSTHKAIYEKVLGKGDDSKIYMGGFLADFRYEKYSEQYKDDPNYFQPFIIDKSDPIPNGVFVISKNAIEKIGQDNMDELIRIWKTVRDVPLGDPNDPNSPKLTGWRTGAKRDLDLVREHQAKVRYDEMYKENYRKYLAISLSILVILISLLAYLFFGRMA